MSAEIYLARRYLLNRGHGAWGFLISLIATGSVALGVAALIVTMAIMTGFREDIQQKMLGVNAHIFLTSFTGEIPSDNPRLPDVLSKEKAVQSWAPYVSGQILIGHGKMSTGATVKGINPADEFKVVPLEKRLTRGAWTELEVGAKGADKHPPIILGEELAFRLGARVGDVVWIITPNSIEITAFSIPKATLFRVVGLLHTGLYDYDSVLSFISLDAAQNLFGMSKSVSGYGVKVSDPQKADEVSDRLRAAFVGDYWVRSWISQNKNLFSALKLERIVMALILAMLTLVASFMIVSNLLLTITQKTREIGILRAMGASANHIRRTFLYQGLIMGLLGNVIGVILGLGISFTLAKTNLIRLPPDVYYLDHLPIRLDPMDIVLVMVMAAVIVLLATLYPASKAAKLEPLDAIRYG